MPVTLVRAVATVTLAAVAGCAGGAADAVQGDEAESEGGAEAEAEAEAESEAESESAAESESEAEAEAESESAAESESEAEAEAESESAAESESEAEAESEGEGACVPSEWGATLECGSGGYCTRTAAYFTGALGGLDGADAACDGEIPGAHFYRAGCDGAREFVDVDISGYGETEVGDCMNCDCWTASSVPYDAALMEPGCIAGYSTVGALVPDMPGADWRICGAGDRPLICCVP